MSQKAKMAWSSKPKFDIDCSELVKAVDCDTNVATGAQNRKIGEETRERNWKRSLILKIKKSFISKKSFRSRNLQIKHSLVRALRQKKSQRRTKQIKVFLKSSRVRRRLVA